MEIAEKTVVSLRYIMTNKEGELLENTLSGPPVQYLHGSGKILPQLESLLTGLRTGDQKKIRVEVPDTFYFDVQIDDIRMATEDEILSGNPTMTDNNCCGPGCDC